jgi:hypothetical protein
MKFYNTLPDIALQGQKTIFQNDRQDMAVFDAVILL